MKNLNENWAQTIADRAVNDDYVEDGGFIKDWLYDDILNALNTIEVASFNRGLEKAARSLETFDSNNPKTTHSLRARYAAKIRQLRQKLRVY